MRTCTVTLTRVLRFFTFISERAREKKAPIKVVFKDIQRVDLTTSSTEASWEQSRLAGKDSIVGANAVNLDGL